MKKILACLALFVTVGCDVTPPRARDSVAPTAFGPTDVRMVPQFADLRVGDRVAFSATYWRAVPPWTWIVTDTMVARIHPDSGTLQALRPGVTNVIATNKAQPAVRGVAPVQVR